MHALLSYPSGRLRAAWRVVVAATYVDGAIRALGREPEVTLVLCAAIALAAIDGCRAESARGGGRAPSTAGALAFALARRSPAGRLTGWDVAPMDIRDLIAIVAAVALRATSCAAAGRRAR